jgi:hypothetical protein
MDFDIWFSEFSYEDDEGLWWLKEKGKKMKKSKIKLSMSDLLLYIS